MKFIDSYHERHTVVLQRLFLGKYGMSIFKDFDKYRLEKLVTRIDTWGMALTFNVLGFEEYKAIKRFEAI